MLPRCAPWSALVAGLLLSAPAAAQSIDFGSGSMNVVRRHQDPELKSDRINRANCLANELIDFRMQVSGISDTSYRLGAWTGSGCETETNRVGAAATCRLVGEDTPWLATTTTLQLSVQDIIAAVKATGTNSGGEGGAGGDDPGVCDGSASPVAFTLHFLLANTSGQSPSGATGAKWDAKFDLKGPGAPTGVKVGIGENRLIVSWTAPTDTTPAELDGFYFFCDPPPGTGTPAVDGGIATCGEPTTAAANACGSALGSSARNGETSVLTNGVRYGVAVAARDSFNNYGDLSDSACEAPQPVTGFFEEYRAAGGGAGGGFCSIGAGRSSALAGFSALALLGLALRRRSARARRGTPS